MQEYGDKADDAGEFYISWHSPFNALTTHQQNDDKADDAGEFYLPLTP